MACRTIGGSLRVVPPVNVTIPSRCEVILSMSTRARRRSGLIAAAMAAALFPATVQAAGTIEVNQSNLGVDWLHTTLGPTGAGAFVDGPATPPLGSGSFSMTTMVENIDKSTLVTGDWAGRSLSELSAIDYWTYRSSVSTSASFVAPSINVAIFTNAGGPGTGFATLVFEPLYSYGNEAIDDDVWQHWDGLAPSVTGFAGGWWTTQPVGSICATACYATLADLQAQAPNATILTVGLNVGRGPASFVGAVDALSLTMAGESTTYDFELLQEGKDSCKDGGWQDFHDPALTFKNQGDCVSHFASAMRQGPKPEVAAAASARHAARSERVESKASSKAAKPAKQAKATMSASKAAKASKSAKAENAKSKSK